MRLKFFLEKHIRGYLFGDLENMSKIKPIGDSGYGAAGYPMVATVIQGMELLGALTCGDSEFDCGDKAATKYFMHFWDEYLSKRFRSYTGFGTLFRKLVRNGIAHNFMPKAGVLITKDSRQSPVVDKQNYKIVVDANTFYSDFKTTYFESIEPLISQIDSIPNTKTMQQMLDSIEKANQADKFADYFRNLPKTIKSITIDSTFASGASLSSIAVSATFSDAIGFYPPLSTKQKKHR